MKKISFILGTRPEAIKLAPIILKMKTHAGMATHVCVTGQHQLMLDQILDIFHIVPDVNLALMTRNQGLGLFTSKAIAAVDNYLNDFLPDLVVVQGDTNTVFSTALCSFFHKIPVAHVEAGLRTWQKYSPFPEEINRVLTSRIADLHFAPTEISRKNLVEEGVSPDKIHLSGNTVIDALQIALERIGQEPDGLKILGVPPEILESDAPLVLITGHRRENFGNGLKQVCDAITVLADKFPETAFIYPVHLNPCVREPVFRCISPKKNVYLIEPLSYLPFIALMNRATLILTDSGGVQEEAPSLGKPVLVMRDTTERPEAVEAGAAKLVGTDKNKIVDEVSTLLTDPTAYRAMSKVVNPYGDGMASERILAVCARFLNEKGEHVER